MEAGNWQRVKNRVIFGFSLLILLIVVTATLTVNEFVTLSGIASAIHEHPLEVSNNALRARMGVATIHSSMKEIYLSDDVSTINKAKATIQYEEERVYQSLDVVRSKIIGDEGRSLEEKCRSLIDQWKPIRDRILSVKTTGSKSKAMLGLMDEEASQVNAIENNLLELTAYAREKAKRFIQHAGIIQNRASFLMILFSVLGTIISLVIILTTISRFNYDMKKYREAEEEKERLIIELRDALSEVKTLSGFLPICSSCKKIRDDQGYWSQIESYIRDHSEAQFSHSICPECSERLYGELTKKSEE